MTYYPKLFPADRVAFNDRNRWHVNLWHLVASIQEACGGIPPAQQHIANINGALVSVNNEADGALIKLRI